MGVFDLKIINIAFIIKISLLMVNGVQIGDKCNDKTRPGECKLFQNCTEFFNVNKYPSKLTFCSRKPTIICCPIKQEITYPEDFTNFSSKQCKEESASRTCDSQAFIVGGSKAERKEFRHAALVGRKLADNTFDWFCSGTLISEKYILSAAHCFFVSNKITNYTRLGELDYSTTADQVETQDIYIRQYITHPNYAIDSKYNDIVLAELDRKAVFNEFVSPACLPLTSGDEFNQFIAIGWGAQKYATNNTSYLRKVILDRFDNLKCNLAIDNDNLDFGVIESTQICAGSNDGRDTCSGDSGGPLLVDHPIYPCMHLIVGITSFGRYCGGRDVVAVYVRIHLYMDWIERIVWKAEGV